MLCNQIAISWGSPIYGMEEGFDDGHGHPNFWLDEEDVRKRNSSAYAQEEGSIIQRSIILILRCARPTDLDAIFGERCTPVERPVAQCRSIDVGKAYYAADENRSYTNFSSVTNFR